MVPKEVRKVENGAFYSTKLTTISFEEYDKNDPNYGQPLLEIAGGRYEASLTYNLIERHYAAISTASATSGNLKTINLPSHLKKLGVYALSGLNLTGLSINFNMDAKVESIEANALSNCGVANLHLPAVGYIGYGALYNCTKMKTLTFHPDSTFTNFYLRTLSNCNKLTAVEIPASVTNLGSYTFERCSSLTSITFAEGSQLEEIGSCCFTSCTALKEFTMPDSVMLMASDVFSKCTRLQKVTLSQRLQYVKGSNFQDCKSLKAILVPEGNVYLKSVDGVLYDVATTILYAYPAAKDPTGFTLPDTLNTISDYALYMFPGTSIELPEHLEIIGEKAFYYSALTSIHIPKNVVSIGASAFVQEKNNGLSLETLTFAPDSRLEEIGDSAFMYNVKLREVNFPDSVHTIGKKCFYGCTALQEIILPASLKLLNYYAFSMCPNYHTIVMQEGLEEIDVRALSDSSAPNTMLKELVIPSTVKILGRNSIAYLHGLEKLTFAEGSQLETIGSYAFVECKKLQELTLPATVRELGAVAGNYKYNGVNIPFSGAYTFRNCNSLRKLDMSACTELMVIPTAFLEDCTALETLLLPPSLERIEDFAFGDPLRVINTSATYNDNLISLKEITIPATVNYIGAYAFNDCISLETVTFAEGSELTELGVQNPISGKGYSGMNIFTGTTSLKTVKLPESLELIGMSCFENSAVEAIELPETVGVIADCAFKNCDNLVEVNLPEALTELGNEAYYDCDKLQKAELKTGLQELGSLAFAYCQQLTDAHIPGSVTMIYGNPWAGCTGITGITKDEGCKDYVLVDGILFDKTMYTLVYYPASATAESFQLPDTVQELAAGAFAGSQLKQFTLPTRFTTVSSHAFGQSQIESITFHNGVSSIGDYAFYGCTKLNNVTLPSSVKQAGNYAFANCTGLSNFVFEDVPDGADPYTIGEHFFDGCTAMTQIVLPNRQSTNTSIPSYMFANSGLVNAVIPARITDITTEGVFYGCKSMETLTFEAAKLTSTWIGIRYFYGCSALRELSLPTSGANSIGHTSNRESEAFAECTSLEKITIISTNSTIVAGYGAFRNCKNLKELNIQKANGTKVGFSSIYAGAFEGCASLTNVVFYAANLYIYGNAFENTGIEVMHIKTGILRLYNGNNFANMPNLKELWMVAKSSTLMADTFENLASDVNIYFYEQTYEEVVALCGEAWFKNASEKAHFFFKGEIPEGVIPPEGVVLPTE